MAWSDDRGHSAYLITDDPGSYLSRFADNAEETQLGMASDLLDHVHDLLTESKPDADELRFFATRLCESLHKTLRIADSRGERLADAADAEAAECGEVDEDAPPSLPQPKEREASGQPCSPDPAAARRPTTTTTPAPSPTGP
jgi:hypothetical protein